MFGADIQAGEQRAIISIPENGTSRKGATVKLENRRLEVAEGQDGSSLSIAPHEDGTEGKFVVQAADGFTIPDGTDTVLVNLSAKADGRPGADVKEIVEPGSVV